MRRETGKGRFLTCEGFVVDVETFRVKIIAGRLLASSPTWAGVGPDVQRCFPALTILCWCEDLRPNSLCMLWSNGIMDFWNDNNHTGKHWLYLPNKHWFSPQTQGKISHSNLWTCVQALPVQKQLLYPVAIQQNVSKDLSRGQVTLGHFLPPFQWHGIRREKYLNHGLIVIMQCCDCSR